MQIPLRGELTLPPASSIHAPPTAASEPSSSSEIESFSNLLNHIARLSLPGGQVPSIQVSEPQTGRGRPVHPKPTPSMTLLGSTVALSKSTREITRPWANTANETASAEAALYPFLVHLAVAKDDVDTLRFCLGITERSGSPSNIVQSPVDGIDTSADLVPTSSNRNLVTGGMANCLDVASGRTPLHVAALNGSVRCAKALLEVGALIHIRDSLDHTALYYVRHNSPLLASELVCMEY